MGTIEGAQAFKVKSMTSAAADAPVYHPTINRASGRACCTCPDFVHRHAQHAPTVQDTSHHCKHLRQALEGCRRRGELGT
jgi:hypothetical protein